MLGIYDARQADSHRRDANDIEADRLIAGRRRQLNRLLPFVLLEDENLDPMKLMQTVAGRLLGAAEEERNRRNSITKT